MLSIKFENKKQKTKKRKTKRQHCKIIIDFVMVMSFIMCVAVIVVGLHTNTSINDVAIEWIKCVAIVLSSGMVKSYFETKEEKRARLEYLKAGMIDKYNDDGSDI